MRDWSPLQPSKIMILNFVFCLFLSDVVFKSLYCRSGKDDNLY